MSVLTLTLTRTLLWTPGHKTNTPQNKYATDKLETVATKCSTAGENKLPTF